MSLPPYYANELVYPYLLEHYPTVAEVFLKEATTLGGLRSGKRAAVQLLVAIAPEKRTRSEDSSDDDMPEKKAATPDTKAAAAESKKSKTVQKVDLGDSEVEPEQKKSKGERSKAVNILPRMPNQQLPPQSPPQDELKRLEELKTGLSKMKADLGALKRELSAKVLVAMLEAAIYRQRDRMFKQEKDIRKQQDDIRKQDDDIRKQQDRIDRQQEVINQRSPAAAVEPLSIESVNELQNPEESTTEEQSGVPS